MLKEWVRFRYGVFSEVSGFKGDPVYYQGYGIGDEMIVVKGCSGQSSDNLHPYFCRDRLDRLFPSKQNLACFGKSTREMINSHQDFDNSSGILHGPENDLGPTRFRYILGRPNRYTVLLDQSRHMDPYWDFVKKSFLRFITSLPTGSTLTIITFGREARIALPPTVVGDSNR